MIKKNILLLSGWLIFTSGIFAQNLPIKNKAHIPDLKEPTAKEAINLIFANGDILLKSKKSCESVGSDFKDRTILDYLSGILSFQTEKNSQNRIEFNFKPVKDAKGNALWSSDLMFYGRYPTGEGTNEFDVWSMGVRFQITNSDRKLLRSSIECIGAG